MFRRSASYVAPFALAFASSVAQAQTAPAAAAKPVAAAAQPTNLAPPPAPPGATGPDAPVSKVTESLEAKLASMQRGNGLTSDQAAQRAVATNVDVVGKSKTIAAADATVDQAKAGFYPSLQVQARYTRLSHITLAPIAFVPGQPAIPNPFPVFLNNYSAQATLNVPLSDYVLRMSNSIASANHSKYSAQIDEQATRLAVARDARVDYYQWIRAQGASYVAQQALEAARGHWTDAKNAFEAGLVSRADVLRAQSQVKSAELTVAHWNNGVAISTEQLRVAMGDPSSVNYEIGENILTDLSPFPVPPTADAAYGEALERRLEMKQLGESEAALREQANAARAGNYPRLDAQANAYYANPNQRYQPAEDKWHATWDASIVLSWTPTNIFGAQAQAKVADAHADEIASKKSALKNALRLEVSQSMNALAEATFALDASREGLAASEESYRVRRELFRAGKSTVVEVTDAETDLTRARLEVVNAHVDLRIARVALAHALGRDVAQPQQ